MLAVDVTRARESSFISEAVLKLAEEVYIYIYTDIHTYTGCICGMYLYIYRQTDRQTRIVTHTGHAHAKKADAARAVIRQSTLIKTHVRATPHC